MADFREVSEYPFCLMFHAAHLNERRILRMKVILNLLARHSCSELFRIGTKGILVLNCALLL